MKKIVLILVGILIALFLFNRCDSEEQEVSCFVTEAVNIIDTSNVTYDQLIFIKTDSKGDAYIEIFQSDTILCKDGGKHVS